MMKTRDSAVMRAIKRTGLTRTGWSHDTAKGFWRCVYRDWRVYARIAAHVCDELVAFRGFGVLKTVHATDLITHVGRVRVDDLRTYDYRVLAEHFQMTPADYNPSRQLTL